MKAGAKNFEVKELSGLNHLFQIVGTGSEYEYFRIGETISPAALQTISGWIHEKVRQHPVLPDKIIPRHSFIRAKRFFY